MLETATAVAKSPSIQATITTITIVHKTGRPRIIDSQENIADIRFNDLIESMNASIMYGDHIKVIYCKFAKNQVAKLVQNTDYAIDSGTVKEKQNGLFEVTLTKHKKHFEDAKIPLFN